QGQGRQAGRGAGLLITLPESEVETAVPVAARGPLAIIGGGIVGLATALAAQRAFAGMEVIVLEKEDRVGAHQSGRNSGVAHGGGAIRTGTRVLGVVDRGGEVVLETTGGTVSARFAVNCAGLHSDRIARLSGTDPGVAILPFRGEYYELAIGPSRAVRGLI